MSSNDAIRSFLRYYCDLRSAPHYAVMLTGPWGAGKTWFVRSLFAEIYPDAKDYLYVSLNGLRSVSEIEDEFFALLHPVLSSKPARLVGKLTQGVLKASLKVDLNSDGKEDGTLSAEVPSGRLFGSASPSDDHVLVFDDLERCRIPIGQLLGYINRFVEHSGHRVVLIANESELLAGESDSSQGVTYRRIKEKVVGKSFEVAPEVDGALMSFIEELPSARCRALLESNRDVILATYSDSGYGNLRLLRHALWEFERLSRGIASPFIDHDPLMADVLSEFLLYAIESYSGSVSSREFGKLQYGALRAAAGGTLDEATQRLVDIRNKYPRFDFWGSVVPVEIWERLFATGSVPALALKEALSKSRHFLSERTPTWVRYWHAPDLSDEEFEAVQADVRAKWIAHEYLEVGTVIHLAGMFLKYARAGLLAASPAEVMAEAKEYVDWMAREGHLIQGHGPPMGRLYEPEGYSGLGYILGTDREIRALMAHIDLRAKEMVETNYPKLAQELLHQLSHDPEGFVRAIIHSNHEDNRFGDVPILAHLPAQQFVDALLGLPNPVMRTVFYGLKQRYRFADANLNLVPERPWLSQCIDLLGAASVHRNGHLSGLLISEAREHPLGESLRSLERAEERAAELNE